MARRPEAKKHLADDVLLRDGAEDAGVAGVGPIVPHNENVFGWYLYRTEGTLVCLQRQFVDLLRISREGLARYVNCL